MLTSAKIVAILENQEQKKKMELEEKNELLAEGKRRGRRRKLRTMLEGKEVNSASSGTQAKSRRQPQSLLVLEQSGICGPILVLQYLKLLHACQQWQQHTSTVNCLC